jgi:signal transduction histidine kinase
MVVADKDRVCQVFLNLLTNATRYSAEGTTITVGADAEDKDSGRVVRIFVRDEGIGIETDDLERIFEKFSTLPKPAWASKGTGLGLYITKQIVDALGGNIWAESKPGGGTTFFFTLPAAE